MRKKFKNCTKKVVQKMTAEHNIFIQISNNLDSGGNCKVDVLLRSKHTTTRHKTSENRSP